MVSQFKWDMSLDPEKYDLEQWGLLPMEEKAKEQAKDKMKQQAETEKCENPGATGADEKQKRKHEDICASGTAEETPPKVRRMHVLSINK